MDIPRRDESRWKFGLSTGARSRYGGFFDFNRARPGKRGIVPPLPPPIARLVDKLVGDGLLPEAARPDSCIVNQYGAGDCIPPHTDHASYARPISTLSLLGEEPMLLGTKFRNLRPCAWAPVVLPAARNASPSE